mmetsp:Transcript_11895/g.25485  ORF Transcript_11895/g.25485 Transcript_11895/m.25485 type:complete len:306 (+) Transcript_11895:3-920(+)
MSGEPRRTPLNQLPMNIPPPPGAPVSAVAPLRLAPVPPVPVEFLRIPHMTLLPETTREQRMADFRVISVLVFGYAFTRSYSAIDSDPLTSFCVQLFYLLATVASLLNLVLLLNFVQLARKTRYSDSKFRYDLELRLFKASTTKPTLDSRFIDVQDVFPTAVQAEFKILERIVWLSAFASLSLLCAGLVAQYFFQNSVDEQNPDECIALGVLGAVGFLFAIVFPVCLLRYVRRVRNKRVYQRLFLLHAEHNDSELLSGFLLDQLRRTGKRLKRHCPSVDINALPHSAAAAQVPCDCRWRCCCYCCV